MPEETLTVESFERIASRQLLLRAKEIYLGRPEVYPRIDILLYWISRMSPQDEGWLLGLHYYWLDFAVYDSKGLSRPKPWEEIGKVTRWGILSHSAERRRQGIESFLRAWESECSPWLQDKPIVACKQIMGGFSVLPVSDFYLLQHYVRLQVLLASAARGLANKSSRHPIELEEGADQPSLDDLRPLLRRLDTMIRQQNQLWRNVVGLRPQALNFY